MTFINYLFKMSDKVEISGFFWKLSCITWCFSGNCLLRWCFAEAKPREGVWCFAGTDTFRGCMMSGQSINGTLQTMRGRSCITTLCNALLVFTTVQHLLLLQWSSLCREKLAKDLLVVFRLIPLTRDALARPCGFCWIESWLLTGV